VDPEAKLSSLSPPFDSQFKVVVDKPNVVKQDVEEIKIKDEAVVTHYDFDKEKKPETCSTCQTECTQEQYCSTSKRNFYLCRSCFVQGKYPLDQSSGHFVVERFQEVKEKEEENEWNEKEEQLLSEALGLYKDDWEKISEHVSTKTHDECILHYLELPVKDPFKDIEIEKLGLLQYDTTQHKENPIMAAVAFLASAVKPQVAAAAGHIEKAKIESPTLEESTEEEDLLELTNTLIKHKLTQYEQQVTHYEALETIVEEQKILLEKEKHQLENDQSTLKKRIISIHLEMSKRGNSATAISNSITPAQLQQQLAGVNPAMFLNGQQPPPPPQVLHQLQLQQQQQQYQLQMQMMQQQQQRANGPGFNSNSMMPL
jgi:SWI/SNF related-matrix-associated actin-dependent regulator of chromatin subfamily C